MKHQLIAGLAGIAGLAVAHADSFYYRGDEAKESLPLKWSVGLDAIWDSNVNPTVAPTVAPGVPNAGHEQSTFSLNPYVGVSFVNVTPQTTIDLYARLGIIYYLDAPEVTVVTPAGPVVQEQDDMYTQARLGLDVTHRFNERLRVVSRNFVSYEMEPNYAYGTPTSRQSDEYFYWQTDNAVGYRWTERLGTYTGFQLTGLDYASEIANSDRFTWLLYHQFRYQLSPQTVLTAEYRYGQTTGSGLASDATDHYILGGIEHRFSENTVGVLRAGAQIHEVDSNPTTLNPGSGSTSNASPYLEAALNTNVNSQFRVGAFARYGIENYDTVFSVYGTGDLYEFDSRETFRLGVTGEYQLSPKLSLFGGLDYIPANFDDGRLIANSGGLVPATVGGLKEDIVNAYIGATLKITDNVSGSLSYAYTNSSSDIVNHDYDRHRVTLGVRAEF